MTNYSFCTSALPAASASDLVHMLNSGRCSSSCLFTLLITNISISLSEPEQRQQGSRQQQEEKEEPTEKELL